MYDINKLILLNIYDINKMYINASINNTIKDM